MKITRNIGIWAFLLLYTCSIGIYGQSGNWAGQMATPTDTHDTKSVGTWDSIEISLLTCQPHQEVYSLYGHTAIRWKNNADGTDIVINYGIFNFNTPHFALRFAFGLTDYEMGTYPFASFYDEYKHYGRRVTEQLLNLTNAEKRKISDALRQNALPENRIYRYNYFYDNCTTRARNIIVDHLDGKVLYDNGTETTFPSFRQMIHQYNEEHPWARFGNDMLLGLKADMKTNESEHQFLPDNLMNDFAKAVIINKDGSQRNLVKKTLIAVPGSHQLVESKFPLRPITCAIGLLVITLLLIATEWLTKKKMWLFDLLLMIVSGTTGIILTAMIFSQHPTVSLNLQILLLNPLPLIFAWNAIRNLRQGKSHWFWKLWASLIVLFFIGSIFQHYAEGMTIVALCLLSRCVLNIKHNA